MSDIRTLLHDAAPKPSSRLQIAALERRARGRRVRRVIAWFAAVATVVGLGVTLSNRLLVTADPAPPATVDRPAPQESGGMTGDHPGRTVTDPPPGRTASTPARPESAGAPTPRTEAGGTTATTSLTPTTATSATTSVSTAQPPPAESCKVDNTGLLPGESRRCEFTATASGGWRFSDGAGAGAEWNRATVTVTRQGEVNVYRSSGFQSCADEVVQPGDSVTVEFVQASQAVSAVAYVAAGHRWSCTERG